MASYSIILSITTADEKGELIYTQIGDVREIATGLTWTKCRTNYGVDEIDFTLNDRIFSEWCAKRNTTINDMLKPYALDCQVLRDGEKLVGGYLATMPAYSPKGTSADLQMRFDGYMNLLNGVYIRPTTTTTKTANEMVSGWISDADSRARAAGKGFGFWLKSATTLASITRTFDNYKTVKEAISDLTDNIDGAGQFDVIFNADRTYVIDDDYGRDISSWQLVYPTHLYGQSVASISAQEIQGFASHVIALGAGEVSSDSNKSTVVVSEMNDTSAVKEYGYCELMNQYSSVSTQSVLDQKANTDLANAENMQWQPQITLIGKQTPPSPTADYGLWIGDRIWLENSVDLTGMTSGKFRVNKLSVSVSGSDAEIITPELERIA